MIRDRGRPARRGRGGRARAAAVAAVGGAILCGAVAIAPHAAAASETQVVQGRILRLVSTADWSAAASLVPGQRIRWDVEVSADAPDPGTVSVGVSAHGGADLRLDARSCPDAWIGDSCPAGETLLRSGWEPAATGQVWPLLSAPSTAVVHLRLDVALADDAAGTTELRVHADGVGDTVAAGPGLAATGGGVQAAPLWLGAGLLLAGALIGAGRVRARTLRTWDRREDGGS